MADLLVTDFVFLALALACAGLVAGTVAGLLGVGGGIIVVPVLFYVFGLAGVEEAVRMHLAIGTSLATIIPTSISSLRSHNKRDAVDLALLKSWVPGLVTGVVCGAVLAVFAGQRTLMLIFATVALAVAIVMAFGNEQWRLGKSVPGGFAGQTIPVVIGGVSTMMGIGGGTLGVQAMTLFNMPIHRAIATASGLGVVISVAGTLGFLWSGWDVPGRPDYSFGFVNLAGFAAIVPATVLAAPWGAKIAHAISRRALKRAFALFLALTSMRMYWDLWSG